MKIIFIGDIVGKAAREKINDKIGYIKKKYSPDIIVANAENATGGYGLSKKDAQNLFSSGLDILTLGNHAWDRRDMLSYIEDCPKIIRAINYPAGVPGRGFYKMELLNGKKIVVVQVMLRLFMGLSLDDPFSVIKKFLISEKLKSTCDAILIDMHGEATSEKNAFAHFVDGSVSAVLGTHTHIPTSDNSILPNGTAYQTDVGMTGDYNSVIGMDIENPIHSFTKGYRAEGGFTPAKGNVSICGAYIETDDDTGLAKNIITIKET
tara:strand:+ start:3791 stop:4582 length:792 start_codon:yes stop_codon:yes gene_type:complete